MEIVPEDLEVLNIWVVDLQSGFLGAASFPWSEAVGGLDSISIMAATFPLGIQGLAIDYRAFGAGQEYDLDERFNEGKTATHELGHFLGLHHPWGLLQDCINDDFCDDTPEQSDFYFRCPGPTESSCSTGEILDLSNFMQFLDDECMDHFTTCQLERMKIVTQTNMTHLLNSSALDLCHNLHSFRQRGRRSGLRLVSEQFARRISGEAQFEDLRPRSRILGT